ncbi:MAG TPA: hypothetical protein VFD45_00775, partial [Patescibacteria group bacterium]|nr:hypothetical protein [Patescibacteria group bacterium]
NSVVVGVGEIDSLEELAKKERNMAKIIRISIIITTTKKSAREGNRFFGRGLIFREVSSKPKSSIIACSIA